MSLTHGPLYFYPIYMSFLAYSTPWDCIADFHNTPHGFTLVLIIQ